MKNAFGFCVLPAFDSKEAEHLRKTTSLAADFTQILGRSEGRTDWQNWAMRLGLASFQHDCALVAQCLMVAVDRNNTSLVGGLRAVLLSLPLPTPMDPRILDSTAQADFFLGDFERGADCLAALAAQFPKYDQSKARNAQLRKLLDQNDLGAALILARSLDPYAKTQSVRIEVFLRNHAYCDIIGLIDFSGGLDKVDNADLAEAYLSSLDALGAVEQAMALAITFLDRCPQSAQVAHQLRSFAMRLDRLGEVQPNLSRVALSLSGQSAGYILLALLAMDADDYARARKILALIDGPPDLEMMLSLALTDPSSTRNQARRAYHAARGAGPSHAGPEMQYASYLINAARRPADLREALKVTQAGLPVSRGNPYFHRLHLSVLIANGNLDHAKAHFNTLPLALRQSHRLREVAIYFDHLAGRHEDAKQAWQDHAKTAGFRVYGAKTTPPRRVKLAPVLGKVVAFSVVYNGMDYLVAYFDHYRALGIKSFVFIDNGSLDGTRAYLALQPDVILYEHAGSFRAAAHGVAWINPLLQRYARGKWALFVDVDEHLVFPLLDQGRTVEDLVDYAQSTGAGSFPSFMLDMFATPRSFAEGFVGHRYFDAQYLRYPSISPPFITVQGGVRGRMTGRYFLITKSPLVRVDRDVHFTENNHHHSYLPTADVTTALLHYKFVGDSRQKFTEAVTRGEHFLGGRFYRDMLSRMRGQGIRAGLWARAYRGDQQLQRLGLLHSAPLWRDWVSHSGQYESG